MRYSVEFCDIKDHWREYSQSYKLYHLYKEDTANMNRLEF